PFFFCCLFSIYTRIYTEPKNDDNSFLILRQIGMKCLIFAIIQQKSRSFWSDLWPNQSNYHP
ncbi:hypothetical protein, partial [Lactobacillus delbrueckii]|uniref:hypothetical protein n=1 Tax=Lactobacillus delbrueckii TaxID=1584 RepID=UPI001E60F81E